VEVGVASTALRESVVSFFRLVLLNCIVLAAIPDVSAGSAYHKSSRYRVYLCCPASVATNTGTNPVPGFFKVFLVGEDSTPGMDFYLIGGPDGKKLTPDVEGLVTVPDSWKDTEVSVRQKTDGKEVRKVELKVPDGKILRIDAVNQDSGSGSFADRPAASQKAKATRRKMLNEAGDILIELRERRRSEGREVNGMFVSPHLLLPEGDTPATPSPPPGAGEEITPPPADEGMKV